MSKYQEAYNHILHCDRDKPHSYISDAYRNDLSVLKELVEKATPKKPNLWGDGYADGELVYDMYDCPNCGKSYEIEYEKYDYCPHCGQALDWGEE